MESESWTAYYVAEKDCIIGFDSWPGPVTSIRPEDFQVLKRFATVFDQAYLRFLDLQKAEAQAKGSQIELGLERVRARAMAMQKSRVKDIGISQKVVEKIFQPFFTTKQPGREPALGYR